MNELKLKGRWRVEVRRGGLLVAEREFYNAIVTEGVNHLFDVGFGGGTQVDPWYIGLINNSPLPTLSNAHTLASHAGWTEFTSYTGNRQAWDENAAASRAIDTNTASAFPITATATLYGMFICSVATGSSGVLFAEGAFSTTLPVNNGDTVNASYTLSAA